MEIKIFITNDFVRKAIIECSPEEWLIINQALLQHNFLNESDTKKAREMANTEPTWEETKIEISLDDLFKGTNKYLFDSEQDIDISEIYGTLKDVFIELDKGDK